MALLYLSLKSKLASSCFNDALKLKESASFRSLILSQISSKSYPTRFAYVKYALNVLFINLILSTLRVAKYCVLNFTFSSSI